MLAFITKWISRLRTILGLGRLFLRYCVDRLFAHHQNADNLHQFSQLKILSPRLRHCLGMTTGTERAYFWWYGKHIYRGRGEIVDLGCWLGSTTMPLAMGLFENPHFRNLTTNIHAYDTFLWSGYMELTVAGTPFEGKYKDGDSFLEAFESRIAPWKDRIKVYTGDLLQSKWNGGPIEFLLIDAMKSWNLANHITLDFFPSLIPGYSYILHQDFAHWFTSWIHIIQYRLRYFFEPVYDIPRSSSMVFKLIRVIPPEVLRETSVSSSCTPDEIDAAFNYSMKLVREDKQGDIAAAKVMLFLHQRDIAQARRQLDFFNAHGFRSSPPLLLVEQRLRSAEQLSNQVY